MFPEDSDMRCHALAAEAVARRVWARTIGEALQTMVEDRQTDLALEQIEEDAARDADVWWDD